MKRALIILLILAGFGAFCAAPELYGVIMYKQIHQADDLCSHRGNALSETDDCREIRRLNNLTLVN